MSFFVRLNFSGFEHQVSGGQADQSQVGHDQEVDGAATRRRPRPGAYPTKSYKYCFSNFCIYKWHILHLLYIFSLVGQAFSQSL
jgi:hypothetical protein